MDQNLLFIIAAVILDGVAGLTGGLLPIAFVHRHMTSLLAFAAGTLAGTAFLELLPEALERQGDVHTILTLALVGFLSFYAIEVLLGSHAAGQSGHRHSTVGPKILIGDALHNATDGVAIAASFAVDPWTGFATTFAVIVHELPQEIGDYTILISHGYSKRKAMLALFAVQLCALVGALGTVWFSYLMPSATSSLMALSAGGFLYITAADLLPELRKHEGNFGPKLRFVAFCVGVGAIAALHHLTGA